ncbi:hypothetical protein M0R04_13715 [Candidatus Dojkabacteria bacterium]|jgi:hypothetical protein|nr:hypothetical protein [Candidatus Dojkabacteria bacterium]
MKLSELIIAVKEQNLNKDQLESYRNQMSDIYAEMQIEIATLEKEEALFMNGKTVDESVAEKKIQWKATQSGQRLIVLKRYCLATKELLNSLKSRLYSIY